MPPPETVNGGPDPAADELLRRMNHSEWLSQFAIGLETMQRDRPVPMTPFRAGAIGRLRMAAAYIELLHREMRDNLRSYAIELGQHKARIVELEDKIADAELNRDLDQHEEGR